MTLPPLPWHAPATLRAIPGEPTFARLAHRAILPTEAVATGTVAALVRRVAAAPPGDRWRYAIESDAIPYLRSEEIMGLAQRADLPAEDAAG